MRGDNIMDGYYKEPQATAAVMTNGWLHTGDMAVWDEDNYIHIVDRKKDIIISGGENISSIEVERAIAAHPAVLECAVVSAPDAQWGEVPGRLRGGQARPHAGPAAALRIPAAAHRQIQDAPPLPVHRYRAAQDRHRQDRQARTARNVLERKRNPRPRMTHIMWQQTYTPIGDSLALSALFAALPIFTLLLLLGVLRKPAWMASLAGLAAAVVVAAGVYGMPVGLLAGAVTYGAAFGLFPIGWVVFSAILLYRITLESGKFEILKDSIGHLTTDPRLQALLIAFAFGAFIEGAAGFGTPVAVAAAMLTGLGFEPFYAAAICLLANTAPVAFGSIAIPITTLAVTTGLPLDRLSAGVGRICAPISLFVPAYLILVMSGWKGLKGVLPAAALCGIAFAGTQFLVSNFMGPQLTDILSSHGRHGRAAAGHPAARRSAAASIAAARSCWPGRPTCCWSSSCCSGAKPLQPELDNVQHPGPVAGPAQSGPAHASRGRQARALSRRCTTSPGSPPPAPPA